MLCTLNKSNILLSERNFSTCFNISESHMSSVKLSETYWAVLAIMGVGVLFGNGLVCILFCRYRNLRDVTNTFVVSLACSDILIPVVLLPCYHSKLSAVPYIVAYILFASLFNFCAVTYDRYEAILHPLRYRSQLTGKKVKRIVILVWTIPIAISLVPCLWENKDFQVVLMAGRIYHGILVSSVITCSLVISLVYFRIFKATRRQLKLIMKHSKQASNNHDKDGMLKRQTSFNCHNAFKFPINLNVEIRAAKVIALLASTFVIFWFPIILLNTYHVLGLERLVPPALPSISLFSLVGNGLLDPIIYSFLKRDFRKALALLAMCRRKEMFNRRPLTLQMETTV